MDVLMEPWSIPTLTGPFCIATWLFLLPRYNFGSGVGDFSHWRTRVKEIQDKVDADLAQAAEKADSDIKESIEKIENK